MDNTHAFFEESFGTAWSFNSVRKFFGVQKNEIGLSEFLAGEKTLDEVLRATKTPGLSFIGTGRYPPNPSELLMRKRMADLIADLKIPEYRN